MKKILLAAILSVLTTYTYAGNLFSTISGMGMEEVKTEAYTIDTVGVNPRVYQFSPKDHKEFLCVIVFPNSDGKHTTAVPTMQCFKVK